MKWNFPRYKRKFWWSSYILFAIRARAKLAFLFVSTFLVLLAIRTDLLLTFITYTRIAHETMLDLWGTFWLGTGLYWLVGILAMIWNLVPIPPNFKDKRFVKQTRTNAR